MLYYDYDVVEDFCKVGKICGSSIWCIVLREKRGCCGKI